MTTPTPLLDAAERDLAIDTGRNILCKAPAGSGKTTLLTHRFLKCLLTVDTPEEVLAVTFTNKAVAEMRHRIEQALALDGTPAPAAAHQHGLWDTAQQVGNRSRALGWNLMADPGRLRILTIDGLNAAITRSAPLFSGLGGATSIEQSPELLYREALLELVQEIDDVGEDAEAIRTVMSLADNRFELLRVMLEPLLARRDQWIEQALMLARDPDALNAFTDEYLLQLASDRLTDASERLRRPLEQLAQAARDTEPPLLEAVPSGFGVEHLPAWRRVAGIALTAPGSDRKIRSRVTVTDGFPAKRPATEQAKAALLTLSEVPEALDILLGLDQIPDLGALDDAKRLRQALGRTLIRLVAHLKVVFQRAGKVDFIEVAMRSQAALEGAGGDRPLAEKLDHRIRHLLVDEAQDTSVSQMRLLGTLTDGWSAGDGRSLFIVGDPQQSIYGWRQAEVRLFVDLWQTCRLGALQFERAPLITNFRSHSEIVDWVNRTSAAIFPRRDDSFSGLVAYSPSVSSRGSGGAVMLNAFRGEAAEAEAAEIVRRIQALPDTDSVAVLVRGRPSLTALLPALRAAGIGYACQDIESVGDTAHVRDLLSLVRSLWHPADRASWTALLRSPLVGMSWARLHALLGSDHSATVEDLLRSQPDQAGPDTEALLAALQDARDNRRAGESLSDMAYRVWAGLGGLELVNETEHLDIRATLDLLSRHERAGVLASAQAFELEVGKLFAGSGSGRVQIMTVHKAKGLEFDHVFLPGLWRALPNDDTPAIQYRTVPGGTVIAARPRGENDEGAAAFYDLLRSLNATASDAEDLRVLYVAMTRPRRGLHIFGALKMDSDEPLHGNSLLARLGAGVLREMTAQVLPNLLVAEAVVENPPRAHRLIGPVDTAYADAGFAARDKSVLHPSESLLRSTGPQQVEAADIAPRLVGIVYHEIIHSLLLSDRGTAFLADPTPARQTVQARLRRKGLPLPQIPAATDEVLRLVTATLTGPNGRWLMQQHPREASEQRLGGFLRGRWVSAAVDRYFEHDRVLQVIDYKTAPVAAGEAETVAQQYRTQLHRYCELLGDAYAMPTQAKLYFPHTDQLVDL